MGEESWILRDKVFNNNRDLILSQAFAENTYADVTLVSDDKIPVKAHKLILSASSPVMKNLLVNHPNSQPLIFLRDVEYQDLKAILQFLYSGQTQVNKDRLEKVIEAGKNLGIDNIGFSATETESKVLVKNELSTSGKKIYTTQHHNQDQMKSKRETNAEIVNAKTEEVISTPDIPQYFNCTQCESKLKTKVGLKYHMRNKHEGISYSCDYCDHKTSTLGNLKHHHESVHEGVRYSCNLCDYNARSLGHLKAHKKSVHDGIKYSCDECSYQTGWKHYLTQHKKAKKHHLWV